MKKRLLTFIFANFLLISSLIRIEAFGGYTHYYISSQVVSCNLNFSNISNEEKSYYLSGAVVADLGWWNWDALYPESDEYEFKNRLVEIAKKSDDVFEKWFALGWSDHVIQDFCTVKTLKNIFKDPVGKMRYRISCGKLDAYFYNKVGYLSTKKMYVPHGLISKTYKSLSEEGKIKPGGLTSFAPDNKLIGNEIWKILWTFYLASWLGACGLYDEEIKKLDLQIEEICKKCGENNADYEILFGKKVNENV